jgi:diguanylate cyclase (GGDEF)-like protein
MLLTGLMSFSLPAQSFPARSFSPRDGLLNRSIVTFAQDSEGFLWVATENGLFRYDGARFELFNRAAGLSDPFLSNLYIDSSGTVWAATPSGLFYSDPRTRSRTSPRFQELLSNEEHIIIPGNSRFAAIDEDQVLASTSSGRTVLLQWHANSAHWTAERYATRHPMVFKQPVLGIFQDQTHVLWFGCGQSICSRDVAHPGAATPAPPARIPPGEYETFFQDRSGRLWARSTTSVVTWRPGDHAVQKLTGTLPPGAFSTYKLRIAQDASDNILLSTATGFLTWNGRSWTPTDMTTAGVIAGATDLFFDREGNLWIGTAGSGAFESLGYRLWQNFGTAEGLASPIVFGIATTRDRTAWVGTKLGVDRLSVAIDSTSPSHPVFSTALSHERSAKWIENLIPTSEGGLWAASNEGRLWHLDASGRIDNRVKVPSGLTRVRSDLHGTLWLAGLGLYTLQCNSPGPCTAVRSSDPLLRSENLNDMVFDANGTLWLVGDHGLYRLHDGAASRIEVPGMPNKFELVATGTDHTVWISGHFPGILRIRANGSAGTLVESHNSPGLASDFIEILNSDAHGRLWIGSDQGIDVLAGGRFTRVTDQDGLIWNDTDGKSFFEDSDGSLWFGTSGGVSHLLHPDALLSRKPFSAAIEQGRYNGVSLSHGAAVPWSGGIMTVRFSGLTFQNNESLLYHYRLQGFDAKTVDTHFPFARFQQLPPGHYTLHVIAEDPAHHVFSSPAEFSFFLIPRWWQTLAFKAFLVVTAVGLVALFWFWSNKALLARGEKLQRLVEARTAELERLAVTDSLTGLMNRGAIMRKLDEEARRTQQRSTPLCIAIIDLDHFKRINDTLGHPTGDEVLREVARRLSAGIRSSDFLGRYGGEEFLVLLRDVSSVIGEDRCEALRRSVCEAPVSYNGHLVHITASIGFAWTCNRQAVVDTMIARADQALYLAKKKGRNRIELSVDELATHLV